MQLRSIRFENYKLLCDTTLPLEPLTVIVGPNDSGKSSVLQALEQIATNDGAAFVAARTFGTDPGAATRVDLAFEDVGRPGMPRAIEVTALPGREMRGRWSTDTGASIDAALSIRPVPLAFRSFALVASHMRSPGTLTPNATLNPDGSNLAVVLDRLRDRSEDRFDALNQELTTWLPAFDRITFDTPGNGMRGIVLRARATGGRVPAAQLSDGTLLALGLLTIVHAEDEQQIIGIEEPEVGLHPRLMRMVRDALLRMAYPAQNGIDRPARQVIVTTHSPYFLDFFRDLPENVVVAERRERDTIFQRLSDRPDVNEILESGPLGEAWVTGVLGGVPVGT